MGKSQKENDPELSYINILPNYSIRNFFIDENIVFLILN